jgi:4-hydroxy-tetrahydrodipicolinate synthase
MAHGGHGCISVTANVAPDACARFFNACLAGDWSDALHLQDRLIRLHKALFLDASPAPTKFVLAHLGLMAEDSRLPIAPCAEDVRAEVIAALEEAERA